MRKLSLMMVVVLVLVSAMSIGSFAVSSPTGLTASNTTCVSTTLSWAVPTDNVGVAGYEIHKNNVYVKTVTTTSSVETGLTPNTTYTYSVLAKDASGNKSSLCPSISVTTPADTVAPTTPKNLSTSLVTSTYAKLTWELSVDNVSVVGYDVYRNNTFLKTVTRNCIIDSGLTELTEYSYYVIAKDGAGNQSTPSTTVNIKTTSVPTGHITLSLDKGIASVGSIIKASINISDIPQFGGAIVDIQYDPTVVQPVNLFDNNNPYAAGDMTEIEGATILTNGNYVPVTFSNFKIEQGNIRLFRAYRDVAKYKQSGVAETTGTLGIIGFKVLKAQPITIKFANPYPNFNEGTSLSDWDFDAIPAGGYKVIQSAPVAGFLYGDVDGNGVFNSTDYAYTCQYLLGMITDFPSPTGKAAADVDGNGIINNTDYDYMKQYLLGMINKFPAEV
ncbi:MAG: cohesin domain-containing protein [Clostridia bacterium]|nr:cohesin domain-containing protein [Clostridia bacterium]